MADIDFRNDQFNRIYDSHISPINRYVDFLREQSGRGWVPYVAPLYGGVDAKLLSVLRDPGPKTREGAGSGFICMENDDQTAEALCNHYAQAGIPACDIVPWNSYPWYINKAPSVVQLRAGAETIAHLLEILKEVRVVMLHGGDAHRVWDYVPAVRTMHVIKTFHPSSQAFIHKDPQVIAERRRHIREAFREAASLIQARG
jgi:hypothetical protein